MRELRHDFRRYYGASYDDVPTDEAIDLVLTLPPGSKYMSALDPRLSWSEARTLVADIIDRLYSMQWSQGGISGDEPPHVVRPHELQEREAEREKRASVQDKIHNTKWKDAPDG